MKRVLGKRFSLLFLQSVEQDVSQKGALPNAL